MTSSAVRFTTLRLGDGSPSSQGIPDCYKGKRGQQLWIPGYRTQKTQKGSTLIIHILGIISVDHHFFLFSIFPPLLVSITSTRGSPGAVSPKLQVLDSLLPQVVEKADGRIRGKDGCFSRSRNLCKLEQVLKLKNIFGEVGLAPIFEGLFETSFFKAIYILVKY